MRDLRKLLLFLGGLSSVIMIAVGLSQIPSQTPQIVSESNQVQAVSAANNQDVINSRGFLLAMTGSGGFLIIIAVYVYVYSDICRREEDVLREINTEVRSAQVVPVTVAVPVPVPAPVPVPVQEIKPILKVTRAPGAPRAPVPFPPRLSIGPIYGHKAEIYKKSIAQRYPQLQPRV
jgi:hypothetical protein